LIGLPWDCSSEGVRFFHPRQDSWEDYFTWNDDYTIVIGKTKIGQITIEAPFGKAHKGFIKSLLITFFLSVSFD